MTYSDTRVSPDPTGPAETLRARILAGGFDRVGFARATQVPEAERFHAWLEAGHAADMDYLARNATRRTDPREIVPDALSVIAVALHYHEIQTSESEMSPGKTGDATISVYARGEDYHRVLERRLKALSRELTESYAGHTFRYYVDTGPVLERSWAQATGIGWIGKNTCAIDSDRGSYFFIGVIITTLEIEADSPATNHCGSCTKCLEACPTDAFAEPFVLDSKRCISYLTIEHRGPIDGELAEKFGSLVFGCDICQQVCPFNKPDTGPIEPELAPRVENQQPSLEELMQLADVEDFRARFPRSAVRRARHPGFIRNLIIALANSGRRSLLPLLERLGASAIAGDAVIQETTKWAKKKLGRPYDPIKKGESHDSP